MSGRHFGTMRGTAVQRDVRGACASSVLPVSRKRRLAPVLLHRQAGGVMIRE